MIWKAEELKIAFPRKVKPLKKEFKLKNFFLWIVSVLLSSFIIYFSFKKIVFYWNLNVEVMEASFFTNFLLPIAFYVPIFFIALSIIFTLISSLVNSVNNYLNIKKQPIARMKYKEINQFNKVFENFELGECSDHYYIAFEDEDICGSLFTYLILMSANYRTKIDKRIEGIFDKIGVIYPFNKKARKDFQSEIDKNTAKMIKSLVKETSKLKKQSNEEIQQAIDQLERVLNNN